MAFTKTFGTADGAWGTATNWLPINVRSAAYSWTASGSGTNEYYLRTAGSADPGFAAAPANVYIDDEDATEGTVGSLTAGQWDYGDNDTLGYSTIYVRLSDGADPDSKPSGFVKFYQVPQAGESVRFTADSAEPTSGLDQSATALGLVIVEEGNDTEFGSETGYLILNTTGIDFAGSGESYIDVGSSAITINVRNSARGSTGEPGLFLKGSAVSVLNVLAGQVGFAFKPGETGTVTDARVMAEGAELWLGVGATTTNLDMYGGVVLARNSLGTVVLYAGELTTEYAAAISTSITQHGGLVRYNSTGTIAAYHLRGGLLDEMQSGAARTISAITLYRGSWQIARNVEAVTHSATTYNDSLTLTGSVASVGR